TQIPLLDIVKIRKHRRALHLAAPNGQSRPRSAATICVRLFSRFLGHLPATARRPSRWAWGPSLIFRGRVGATMIGTGQTRGRPAGRTYGSMAFPAGHGVLRSFSRVVSGRPEGRP